MAGVEPEVILELRTILHVKVAEAHPLIPPPENFSAVSEKHRGGHCISSCAEEDAQSWACVSS